MSLLVHKLVLGPSGGSSTQTSSQTSSASSSVPVSIVNSSGFQPTTYHLHQQQLSHVQSHQHSVKFTYTNQRSGTSENRHHERSVPSESSSSSGSSRHYTLPFQLQDHNYGAPPPPTPPQSPPPPPPSQSQNIQPTVHPTMSNYSNSGLTTHIPSHGIQTLSRGRGHKHTVLSQRPAPISHQFSPQNTYRRTPVSTSITSSPVPVVTNRNTTPSTSSSHPNSGPSAALPAHVLSSMPAHRRQFMPQPKTSPFSSPTSTDGGLTPVSIPQPNGSPLEIDDDSRLSDRSSSVGPSGEETETAPEGEGDESHVDDSITRCICDLAHDDGYMIQCDHCFVWQHVACMELDRSNIPDEYLCEACMPRPVDRMKARTHQIRRQQEIKAALARMSSSDTDDEISSTKNRSNSNKNSERKTIKKKKKTTNKEKSITKKSASSSKKKATNPIGSSSAASNITDVDVEGDVVNSTVNDDHNNNNSNRLEEKDRRTQIKLRRRKSSSMSMSESTADEISSIVNVDQLQNLTEDYEIAVTNHYSPELRARVHAARINGISADLKASTQGAVLGHRCKVILDENCPSSFPYPKTLVATTRLTKSTAIIEYQGKYLLSSQLGHQSHKILPYTLHYRMPKEGFSICVDARKYGNDARFARRSCQPNADIRHVVERGSLHLYVVAKEDIEEGDEILLSIESYNSSIDSIFCQGDNHHHLCCYRKPTTELSSPQSQLSNFYKKNALNQSTKKVSKKLSPTQSSSPGSVTSSTEKDKNYDSKGDISDEDIKMSPIPSSRTSRRTTSESHCSGGMGSLSKSTRTGPNSSKSVGDRGSDDSSKEQSGSSPTNSEKNAENCHKMTREERKIAAYIKAFERLEKAQRRRKEMEKRKGEERLSRDDKDGSAREGDDEDGDKTSSADESFRQISSERPKRKGKKGKSNNLTPQKRMRNRTDSATSDLTGDESGSASNGLCSPDGGLTDAISITFNPNSSQLSNFKFPKTKKSLMNEWLNETVDPVLHMSSSNSTTDVVSGVPTCYMRSPTTPVRRASGSSVTQGCSLSNISNMDAGSAKKRWLRQAISEETEPTINGLCSSPNSRPDSPVGVGLGGCDYITPLKKRRMARESMSSEFSTTSATPPTTPQHNTNADSVESDLVESTFKSHSLPVEEFSSFKVTNKFPNECKDRQFNVNRNLTNMGDERNMPMSKDIVKEETERGICVKIQSGDSYNRTISEDLASPSKSLDIKVDVNIKCESDMEISIEDRSPISEDIKTKVEEKPPVNKSCIIVNKSTCSDVKCDVKQSVDDVQNEEKLAIKIEKEDIEDQSPACPDLKIKIEQKNESVTESKPKVKSDTIKDSDYLENVSDKTDENKLGKQLNNADSESKFENESINDKSDSTKDISNCDSVMINENHNKCSSGCKDLLDPNLSQEVDETTKKSDDISHDSENQLSSEEYLRNSSIQSPEREFLHGGPKTPDTPIPEHLVDSDCEFESDKNTPEKCDSNPSWLDKGPRTPPLHEFNDQQDVGDSPSEKNKPVTPKPAPVKRKLSILEYRKRKSVNSESEKTPPTSEPIATPSSSTSSSTASVIEPLVPIVRDVVSEGESSPEFPLSPIQLPTMSFKLTANDQSEGDKDQDPQSNSSSVCGSFNYGLKNAKDVKWDDAPTVLELQRENLSARLRREFGIGISENKEEKLKASDQEPEIETEISKQPPNELQTPRNPEVNTISDKLIPTIPESPKTLNSNIATVKSGLSYPVTQFVPDKFNLPLSVCPPFSKKGNLTGHLDITNNVKPGSKSLVNISDLNKCTEGSVLYGSDKGELVPWKSVDRTEDKSGS